ncbi:hypothetical protein BX600DRAFT_95124 [Xylariales sp. PMI_506]|nr:hypothetical protein BX600DRAFT_95124 [Xylariales sp. PMI_506]
MIDLPLRKVASDDSSSDYENSPPSSVISRSLHLPSPENYLSTTGSILERQISRFGSPRISQLSPRADRTLTLEPENDQQSQPVQYGSFSKCLSESEWMRRTPSPVERQPSGPMWSPGLDKKLPCLQLEDNLRSHHSDALSNQMEHNYDTGLSKQRRPILLDSKNEPCGHALASDIGRVGSQNHTSITESVYRHHSCTSSPFHVAEDRNSYEKPMGNWI